MCARDATAVTTATAANVAAAHPAGSNRLTPKGALQRRAGGRWKRDARREMGAGERRQVQHGGAETRWRRRRGGQIPAGRPGNAPPKPARPAVRRRAKGERCSLSSARLRMQAAARRWRDELATFDISTAPSQSPAACANSPSMPKNRAGRNQRFVGRSTTTTMHRAEVFCFWPAARLDSTSRSSARQSRRGCGLWGGWDAGAVSATAGRSFCLTRDGADLASSWRALDVVIEDLQRTRNFLSRLRLPHACDGGKAYYIRAFDRATSCTSS